MRAPKEPSFTGITVMLVALIVLSFAYGAAHFASPEARKLKLEQAKHRYQAKYSSRLLPVPRQSPTR